MSKREIFNDQFIIVTGACGFIGANIIARLNELGHTKNIIAVDDWKSSIKWKNLIGKKYGELLSRFELADWLKDRGSQIEAIIHMGANSSTTGTSGDEYYRMNYRFSIMLAEFAFENDIPLIYASSAATYGLGENGFADDTASLHHLQPLNLYGMSKLSFDLWIDSRGAWDKVVGFKFFNVYGPGEIHKERMASMVYHMYHQIQKEGKVRLFRSTVDKYEDGGQQRDFIYVKDVANVVCDALTSGIRGLYNLGTGTAHSWNSLAKHIFQALRRPVNIEYIPMPDDIVRSYQQYTCAEMGKLESKMDLQFTPLEQGVREYVVDYLDRKPVKLG